MSLLSHSVPVPLKKALAPCPAQMWEEGAREKGWRVTWLHPRDGGMPRSQGGWAAQASWGQVRNGPHRPLLFWPCWSAAVGLASWPGVAAGSQQQGGKPETVSRNESFQPKPQHLLAKGQVRGQAWGLDLHPPESPQPSLGGRNGIKPALVSEPLGLCSK